MNLLTSEILVQLQRNKPLHVSALALELKLPCLPFCITYLLTSAHTFIWVSLQKVLVGAKVYTMKSNSTYCSWSKCFQIHHCYGSSSPWFTEMMDSMCSTVSPRLNQIEYTHWNKTGTHCFVTIKWCAKCICVPMSQRRRLHQADAEEKLLNHHILQM